MPNTLKPSILEEIVDNKRKELAIQQQGLPLEALKAEVYPLPRPFFEEALNFPPSSRDEGKYNMKLILEIKPSSPSAGILKADFDLDALLAAYRPYADCLSVLTDQKYFRGSMERLSMVSQRMPQPTLCKDFILDPYQVYQARKANAMAVLLIVKILNDEQLRELYQTIRQLGMTPVVEVQNEDEWARTLYLLQTAQDQPVILINNRNLTTFEVDLSNTLRLAPLIRIQAHAKTKREAIIISASGIQCRADIERLLPAAHCFLIGSSLMRLPMERIPEKLQELCGK